MIVGDAGVMSIGEVVDAMVGVGVAVGERVGATPWGATKSGLILGSTIRGFVLSIIVYIIHQKVGTFSKES